MSSGESGRDIEELEKRLDKISENLNFLKDLLFHIKSQFEEFKRDVDRRIK